MAQQTETQFEIWNGASAERWVTYQERLDRLLDPIDLHVQKLADAQPGERVIDVGCGCGTTSLRLAQRVGPEGSVVGVDISKPMLAHARTRSRETPWLQFREGDATEHPFAGDADLVYSRFGVMFFDAPERAFANLRRALKDGGRISFVCWQALGENPWFDVPLRAAASIVPLPPVAAPDQPGPFSLAPEARIRALLGGAGFREVTIAPLALDLVLSENGLDDAVTFAVHSGPLARLLTSVPESTRTAVLAAVKSSLEPFLRGSTVALPSATWLVRAR